MTLPKRRNFDADFQAAIAQIPAHQPNAVQQAAVVVAFAQGAVANAVPAANAAAGANINANQQHGGNLPVPMDVEYIEEEKVADNNQDQPQAHNPRRG